MNNRLLKIDPKRVEYKNRTAKYLSSYGTILTISRPTVINGDFMVAIITIPDTSLPISAPTGWTRFGYTTGFRVIVVYTKWADNEPSSYTWQTQYGENSAGMIAVFKNVNPTTPIINSSFQTGDDTALVTAQDTSILLTGGLTINANYTISELDGTVLYRTGLHGYSFKMGNGTAQKFTYVAGNIITNWIGELQVAP